MVQLIQIHLELTNFYSPLQHGFRSGLSCTKNLVRWVDTLHHIGLIFQGYIVVQFDYSRAFDITKFNHVSDAMKKAKIHKNIILSIQEWMSGRTQYTSVGGFESNKIPVQSSTVQGSSFGPTGFNLVINELFEEISWKLREIPGAVCSAFADDTKIVIPWYLKNPLMQVQKNQEIIDIVSDFAERKDLILNGVKCKITEFGKIPLKADYFVKVNGIKQKITPSTCERDLGIYLQGGPQLNFDHHIKQLIDRCNIVTKNARHTIKRLEFKETLHVWHLYVRSIAMYAGLSWFRVLKKDMEKLNKLYRDFWKIMSNKVPFEETPLTIFQELILESLMFHHSQHKLKPKEKLLASNPLDPFTDKTFTIRPEITKIPISTPPKKRKYVKIVIPSRSPCRVRRCRNPPIVLSPIPKPNPPFTSRVSNSSLSLHNTTLSQSKNGQSSTFKDLHRKIFHSAELNSGLQNSPRHRLFQIFDSLPTKLKNSTKKSFRWFCIQELLPKISPECQLLRSELSDGTLFRKNKRAQFYQMVCSYQRNGKTLMSISELQSITGSNTSETSSLISVLQSDPLLVDKIIEMRISQKRPVSLHQANK